MHPLLPYSSSFCHAGLDVHVCVCVCLCVFIKVYLCRCVYVYVCVCVCSFYFLCCVGGVEGVFVTRGVVI